MRDTIELAEILIYAGGIWPAVVDASSFPSLGSGAVPEVRTPVLTRLTFEGHVVEVVQGRAVLRVTSPVSTDLSPVLDAAAAFVNKYLRASWRLGFIIQLRCPVPDGREPKDWLRRLVQPDAIAEIQGPLPFDVLLEVPFQFAPGRGLVRIERSRAEPLNAILFSMHYSFDDSSIQDLGKFGTCVSEASYLADRVMALVPTDIEH